MVAALLATAGMGLTSAAPAGAATPVPEPQFEPLDAPQRIADTRSDGETVDNVSEKTGTIKAGRTLTLQVAGRAGVGDAAAAATLNVVAVGGTGPGFLTVYPCGQDRPNSSNVNYFAGTVHSNAVFAGLNSAGRTCIYALTEVHVVVDVNGWMPAGVFDPLDAPQRIADTRPEGETVDGANEATGAVRADTELVVQVAGRAGIDPDAEVAVLNVTVANGASPGFLAAYPCGEPRPISSNVNYTAGQITANSVIAKLDSQGRTCIYSLANADVIVDVSGSLSGDFFVGLDTPKRIVDSRPEGETVDNDVEKDGFRRRGTTLQFPVSGRADIPPEATAVALNVTIANGVEPGFLSLHPRNSPRPTASSVNFYPNSFNANLVVAGLGGGGMVCLFASADVEVIVDVAGYYVGDEPADTGTDCPFEFPIRDHWDGYPVGQYQMKPGRYIADTPPANKVWCDATRQRFRSFAEFRDGDDIFGSHGAADGRLLLDVRAGDGFLDYRTIAGIDTVGPCDPLVPYVPKSPPTPTSSFGPGDHIVGQHILPGVYQATKLADYSWCIVAVHSASVGFDGSDSQWAGHYDQYPMRRYEDVNGVTTISVANGEHVSVGNGCSTFK